MSVNDKLAATFHPDPVPSAFDRVVAAFTPPKNPSPDAPPWVGNIADQKRPRT